MPIEYKTVMDGDYPRECDCCGSEAPLAKFNSPTEDHPRDPPDQWYCEVCSGSFISKVVQYPRQYDHQTRYLMVSLAQAINIVLRKLENDE